MPISFANELPDSRKEILHYTGSSLSIEAEQPLETNSIVPAVSEYFASSIHAVGQVFRNKEHLQLTLTNYAMSKGFDWQYLKNDLNRLTVKCKDAKCQWRVHTSTVGHGSEFVIKTMNNIHTCGCDIMTRGHPRSSKKWVSSIVKNKLTDTPTYRACDMKRDIQREYGICIPYHQV